MCSTILKRQYTIATILSKVLYVQNMSQRTIPSHSVGRKSGVWLVYVLVFGYALIRGQFLLGVLAVVGIRLVFVSRRFLFAVESIADSLQRISEQESD